MKHAIVFAELPNVRLAILRALICVAVLCAVGCGDDRHSGVRYPYPQVPPKEMWPKNGDAPKGFDGWRWDWEEQAFVAERPII